MDLSHFLFDRMQLEDIWKKLNCKEIILVMRILHYFLGFPPYRTGGLTKFAFDLMKEQINDGNDVMALWPGEIKSYCANPQIKQRKNIEKIKNYELINPLPVSLDEGIKEITAFIKECDVGIYTEFLNNIGPNVIHIHTLMGLHKEFIEAANQLGIRMVYTSHDYFGLCPKVTLYRDGKCCDDDHCCKNCIQCNLNGLSLKKIQIMQSPFYRWAKNTIFVKKLRERHRSVFFAEEKIPDMPDVDVDEFSESYRKLRNYYLWMYEHIDFIHFNSTVSESIFKRYIKPKRSGTISITHKDIMDNIDNLHIKSEKVRFVYLAPTKPFKGFNLLREALDDIWNLSSKNFELKVFSPVAEPSPYMRVKEEGFSHSELGSIFSNADVLVAPSVWYETFGFTVIEALSYGVPVIVSDHVGAKDIIGEYGIVFESGKKENLKDALSYIMKKTNMSKIIEKKKTITIKKWSDFTDEIMSIYEEIIR